MTGSGFNSGSPILPGLSVMADLTTWGPGTSSPPLPLAEAEAYCRRLAQSHYENFPVASWFLPRHLHQHFFNVYAYCRWADDLGDETGNPAQSLQLLRWWESELDRCFAGQADHPVFIALMPTIQRFSIPREPFANLISAFIQDQSIRQYESMDQLVDYCRRSADPVGRIVLALCERFTPENASYSDSICTGLQLANFWQDVKRDSEIGRTYIPREIREKFGYSADDLKQHRTTAGFIEMMRSLVADARQRLLQGEPLIARMPGRLQIDIDLFQQGGLLILKGIERIQYRVWDQRPTVSKFDLALAGLGALTRGLCRAFRPSRH